MENKLEQSIPVVAPTCYVLEEQTLVAYVECTFNSYILGGTNHNLAESSAEKTLLKLPNDFSFFLF